VVGVAWYWHVNGVMGDNDRQTVAHLMMMFSLFIWHIEMACSYGGIEHY